MKNNKIIKIALIFFAIAILTNIAPNVFATEDCKQTKLEETTLQTEWPASPLTQKTLSSSTTIAQLVQYVFEWGVGLGGLAVFIALIIAGVQYITSVADPNKVNEAKDRIKSSVIGLVLLLSSWAIFNLINPNLNTLRDITDIGSMIVAGGIATERTCNNDWECCEIANCDKTACDPNDSNCCINLNCDPENFACCQKNDSQCIEGKKPKPGIGATPYNKKPNGETSDCKYDTNCQDNYCYCDRSKNPWKQYCKENPKVCINIFGDPELGCDFIGFYSSPDHSGTPTYYRVEGSDSSWIAPAGNIKSYQAFRAARNQAGEYLDENGKPVTDINLAKKVNCGKNSCGCTIDICDDPNPTLYRCSIILEFGLAFNTNVDGDHTIVEIKDDTKTMYAKTKNWLKEKWENLW